MADPSDLDALFQKTVAALDAGDTVELERLVTAHPSLLSERLESPGEWLRQQVGRALDGFFARPYLLWFTAEDPVRRGTLPANMPRMLQLLVDAARARKVETLEEQLAHALRLVAWSPVAARCGLQQAMIDVLIDAGAALEGTVDNALVNGHFAAAEHLEKRGAPLTLASALVLGRWDAADRLAPQADPSQLQHALVLAALKGNAPALRWLIDRGADPDAPSPDLYPHGTPLHHAVASGSLEAVQVLTSAGAKLDVRDSAWGGTPSSWAEHCGASAPPERRPRYTEISEHLRDFREGAEKAEGTPASEA